MDLWFFGLFIRTFWASGGSHVCVDYACLSLYAMCDFTGCYLPSFFWWTDRLFYVCEWARSLLTYFLGFIVNFYWWLGLVLSHCRSVISVRFAVWGLLSRIHLLEWLSEFWCISCYRLYLDDQLRLRVVVLHMLIELPCSEQLSYYRSFCFRVVVVSFLVSFFICLWLVAWCVSAVLLSFPMRVVKYGQ